MDQDERVDSISVFAEQIQAVFPCRECMAAVPLIVIQVDHLVEYPFMTKQIHETLSNIKGIIGDGLCIFMHTNVYYEWTLADSPTQNDKFTKDTIMTLWDDQLRGESTYHGWILFKF